jgi:hypothetical protein
MEKNGVYSFLSFKIERDLNLKSKALFFDKIFIDSTTVSNLKKTIQNNKDVRDFNLEQAKQNISELEFLLDVGFLDTFGMPDSLSYTKGDKKLLKKFKEGTEIIKFHIDQGKLDCRALYEIEGISLYLGDLLTKFSIDNLKRSGINHLYPIFDTGYFEGEQHKHDVLHFILRKLPVPHEDTSWEQIVDFRKDKDSKSKYFALVHWVNSVARSERPLIEIEDEYNYLYDQYIKHLKLHRIKTSMSTMEIIVNAGIDALASLDVTGVLKNLFSYKKTRISLLEDELKLPGQEIAFIHKSNERFK